MGRLKACGREQTIFKSPSGSAIYPTSNFVLDSVISSWINDF